MRNKTTIVGLASAGVLLCSILTGCGNQAKKPEPEEPDITQEAPLPTEAAENEAPTPTDGEKKEETEVLEEAAPGELIQEQSFEVELQPVGKVKFESYQPDRSKAPYGDAIFAMKEAGQDTMYLPEMTEKNLRTKEVFHQVEAVSFQDYDNDGCDDIFVICSYTPEDNREAYSEIRIYHGDTEGHFTLERQLSQDANSALEEKTIGSLKGFLGCDRKPPIDDSWKQTLIEDLKTQAKQGSWAGYQLIYVDEDEIPEVVLAGQSEAAGNLILYYKNGKVEKLTLARLYFTYIEKSGLIDHSEGLMDHYYDEIIRLKDGEIVQIAAGYYGTDDEEYGEEASRVYTYSWNGQEVSKEEYYQSLNAVYDTKRAKDGYDYEHLLSLEEVIDKINGL